MLILFAKGRRLVLAKAKSRESDSLGICFCSNLRYSVDLELCKDCEPCVSGK